MNRIIELLGLWPDTSPLIRLKPVIAGFCALVAGPCLIASGIDGSMIRGGLITACGTGLIAVVLLSSRTRGKLPKVEHRQEECHPIEQPALASACQHHWVNPDDPHDMLNYSYLTLRCTECGEERSAWGREELSFPAGFPRLALTARHEVWPDGDGGATCPTKTRIAR